MTVASVRVVALIAVMFGCGGAPPAQGVSIHFLDVGQGSAVLIQSPEGHNVLVDAGPSQQTLRAVTDLGVESLDLLILTHNPSPETVALLKSSGARILRTHEHGLIRVLGSSDGTVRIDTARHPEPSTIGHGTRGAAAPPLNIQSEERGSLDQTSIFPLATGSPNPFSGRSHGFG